MAVLVKRCSLKLLGEVSIESGETAIRSFGTMRATKLLVLLATSRNGRLPREALADNLWPEDFYDATRLRLRQEIHRLKRALGPFADLVDSTSSEVSLDLNRVSSDLDLLRCQNHARLNSLSSEEKERLASAAFMPGQSDPWVEAERSGIKSLQREFAAREANALIDAGDHSKALQFLEKTAPFHAGDEGIRLLLARCRGRVEGLSSALRGYKSNALGETSNAEQRVSQALPVLSLTGDLPVPLDVFHGRQDLLAALLDEFAQEEGRRLVTLIGPGGIGKTRLALEVGRHILKIGDQRVLFASLVGVNEPKEWSSAALTQLRAHVPRDTDPVAFFASLLDSEPSLLILDNLEGLAQSISQDLSLLLSRCLNLKILATSISPLKIQGEVTFALGPLETRTEGKNILLDAARSFRPMGSVSNAGEMALEEVSVRLDGYPLALKLAAARLRFLSPVELLKSLDDPLTLRASSPDLPDRHRTLEAAFKASTDSLSQNDLDLLSKIAVFPQGCRLQIAQELSTDEGWMEALERLVESALLFMDDRRQHARFGILEPVRQYLLALHNPESRSRAYERASESLLHLIESLGVSPENPLTIERQDAMDEEHENLALLWDWTISHRPDLAVRFASSLAAYELARGRGKACQARVLAVQDHWMAMGPETRMEMELIKATLAIGRLQKQDASEPLTIAEGLATVAGGGSCTARLALLRAAHRFFTDYQSSEAAGKDALDKCSEFGSPYLIGLAHRQLGSIYHYAHQSEAAISHLGKAFSLLSDQGALDLAAYTALFQSNLLWQADRREEARESFDLAKEMMTASKDPACIAFLHESQGRLALSDGRPEEAESCFRESLRLWQMLGSDFQQADQLLSLTRALIDQGKWKDASEALATSADYWLKDRNEGGLCQSLTSLALILHVSGRTDEAKRALGYSVHYQAEAGLVLVKPEIEFRQRIIDLVGGIEDPAEPLDIAGAHTMFKLLEP